VSKAGTGKMPFDNHGVPEHAQNGSTRHPRISIVTGSTSPTKQVHVIFDARSVPLCRSEILLQTTGDIMTGRSELKTIKTEQFSPCPRRTTNLRYWMNNAWSSTGSRRQRRERARAYGRRRRKRGKFDWQSMSKVRTNNRIPFSEGSYPIRRKEAADGFREGG